MICLKLATRTGSFQVEVDATPADCGVANINYERKPLAVPGTWNTGTNYADSRYQLPQIDNCFRRVMMLVAHVRTFLSIRYGLIGRYALRRKQPEKAYTVAALLLHVLRLLPG